MQCTVQSTSAYIARAVHVRRLARAVRGRVEYRVADDRERGGVCSDNHLVVAAIVGPHLQAVDEAVSVLVGGEHVVVVGDSQVLPARLDVIERGVCCTRRRRSHQTLPLQRPSTDTERGCTRQCRNIHRSHCWRWTSHGRRSC